MTETIQQSPRCTQVYKIGDCLELMKEIPDKSINLIITDPPYSGNHAKSKEGRFAQAEHHIDYDDMSERAFLMFMKPILRELYRVLVVGGHFYCFTDWKQLRNMMDCIELASFKVVNLICWDKKHFGTGAGYRSQSEYILVFSKGLPHTFNLNNIGNVLQVNRETNNYHPHQKPIELIKLFVNNSTNEGDCILDPFLGSGTTLRACLESNRNGIGFEINPDYEPIIRKRLMADIPPLEVLF